MILINIITFLYFYNQYEICICFKIILETNFLLFHIHISINFNRLTLLSISLYFSISFEFFAFYFFIYLFFFSLIYARWSEKDINYIYTFIIYTLYI